MDEKMRDKYLRIFSVACLLTLSGCGVKDVSEANTDGVKISVSIKHHQENDYPEPVSQQLEVSISLNEDDIMSMVKNEMSNISESEIL